MQKNISAKNMREAIIGHGIFIRIQKYLLCNDAIEMNKGRYDKTCILGK